MISINATLLLQILHIIILILILNRLMFRPILKLTRERKEFFRSTKNEIKEIQQQAEHLREEFDAVQRDARKEASLEAAKIRGAGMTIGQDHIEGSKKVVASIRNDAEEAAEKETEKTKPLLRGEAVSLADEITERLMGRRMVG